MTKGQEINILEKIGESMLDFSAETRSKVNAATHDGYVLHVSERALSDEFDGFLENEIDRWWLRQYHIVEKYGLSFDEADIAIWSSELIVRMRDRGQA